MRLRGAPQYASIADAVAAGARWHRATERAAVAPPDVRVFGDLPLPLSTFFAPEMPERGVLELDGATIVGSGGWVLDRRGRAHPELTWFGSDVHLIAEAEAPPPRDRRAPRIRGSALVLMSTWGEHFGHFIPDALGRLAVARAAGLDLASVDAVVVPAHRSPEGERTLARLGLADDRLVRLERGQQLRVDRALAPTLPGLRRQYLPMVPHLLRAALGDPPRGGRRLLVVRDGYGREPIEWEQIEALADARGFERYDPMASDDQAADFAAAAAVVGVSGSALTGIASCAPGTRVLEIFSDAHLYGYYCTLAVAGDLEYGAIVGRSGEQAREMGPNNAAFSLDLTAMAEALDWATNG